MPIYLNQKGEMMMNNKENDENKVKKIIPSKLETSFQKLLYKTLGKYIPKKMTPNQITTIGAIGGFIGIICAFLGKLNPLFLIGTILGLLCHLICDDLDGYVARTRNMSSSSPRKRSSASRVWENLRKSLPSLTR